jgi:enamine deaminase RidA (YjgF/YER057c/UK114 family)
MSAIEQKLNELGVTLPEAKPLAGAAYVPYTLHKGIVTVSGTLPMKDGAPQFIGKVGREFSIEQGQECARLCAINILTQLKKACEGNWDKLEQTIRLGIFVNSTDNFTDAPKVANGASNLIKDVLGEKGNHARFAVSVAQLPFGCAVEVDAVFGIK